MSSQNDRDRFNWLHFGNWLGPTATKDRAARSRWKALGEDLASLHDEAGPWDAVFLSGDIAQMGTPSEYEVVTEQLGDLLDKLSRLGSQPVVLTVPGNGDGPRADIFSSGHPFLNELIGLLPVNLVVGSPQFREIIRKASAAYDDWSREAALARPQVFRRGALPGDFTATLPLGTWRIGVSGLNTALLRSTEEPRLRMLLLLDPHQLQDACGGEPDDWAASHDLRLLLTHYPPSWLGPESRRAFYAEIAPPSRFALHLCSQADPKDLVCVQDGRTLLIQAPPLAAEGRESGYIAGSVSLEPGPEPVTLRPRRYQARPRGIFVPDPSYSPDLLVAYRHSVHRTKASLSARAAPGRAAPAPEIPFRVRFLEIQNFRCFDRIAIDFEQPSRLPGRWTCVAGINGSGKSSILQALALVLLGDPDYRELGGDRLERLRRVAGGIRQETRVRAWLEWVGRPQYIELWHPTVQKGATALGDVHTRTMHAVWEDLRSRVILAYGATRNLSDFVDTRYGHVSPDVRRVMTLFDPLAQITSAEFLVARPVTEKTPLLRLFQPLLRQVFGDDLGVEVRDGRVVFTSRGEPVEAVDLPDGFRSSIAWLVDLCATWCEKNPERAASGKAADIEAFVLIDEIDLHLHPSLQRTLVPRLRAALPRVQWVVTTHSPLVLSSFDTAEIVALDRDEPGGVRFLDRQILGFTADQIYNWLMGTPTTSAALDQELAQDGAAVLAHSDKELAAILMMSPEVSAAEAEERARQLHERVKRLGR
jgi:hypothetical protein